jgi:organic radical activating enzyme
LIKEYNPPKTTGRSRADTRRILEALLRCVGGCAVETWPLDSGVEMEAKEVVERVLDPVGEPRDGVSVLGGEPFLQLDGLLTQMGRSNGAGSM